MEISNNILNNVPKYTAKYNQANTLNQTSFGNQTGSVLPSVCANGVSCVNSNIPIGYTKIADVPVPGLDKCASVYRLNNGQKIVICPKKGPTFIKTTYNVGSLNETEDLKGISHYIEHNLFNGSKGLAPKEYDLKLSQLGGGTNASTDLARTDYYLCLQLLNDNSLEEAIKLNAMQTQHPTFPADQLEKEKEPVKSEIDVYDDKPESKAYNTIIKNLFGIDSSVPELTLGTKDHINSFTREKVLDYFNTWYTPDNAVTVITGDVDADETINLVSKYYNKQNDYSNINKRYSPALNYIQNTVRTDFITQNSTGSQIVLGFAVPEGTSKEDTSKYELLLDILSSSSSKLSKALNKYGIKAEFEIADVQNKQNSAKAIICYVNPDEKDLEDVLKILYREIYNIANNPPSFDELNNAKTKHLYSMNSVSESSDLLNSKLTKMIKNNDFNYFNEETSRINSISPYDISDAARRFLDLNKTSICVLHSKDASNQSVQNNYNQSLGSQTISFGRSTSPNDVVKEETQKIKEFKLPNNVETKFIPSSSNIKSTFLMSFETDELNDFSSSAINVLSLLLNRGSAFRSYDDTTAIEASKDCNLSFHANGNGIMMLGEFYPKDAGDVITLCKETITAPNFSAQEFERAKTIIRNKINSKPKNSYDNLLTSLFPSIKNYESREQSLKELDALTINDIQNLYSRIMQTAQVRSTITAPVEENPAWIDFYNNSFALGFPVYRPVTKEKSPSFNVYQPITEAKLIKEAEDNTQAQITQAYTFKHSDNIDDIAKIQLLNYILGAGGMSSRLFLDLRENAKLAYSVYSTLETVKDTDILALNIETTTQSPDPKEGSPANVTKSIDRFNANVNLLKTTLVPAQELDKAKTLLKTSLLNEMETSKSKLFAYHSMETSPYDNNYQEALLQAIDRVSAQDIQNAANYVFKNPPATSIVASQKTFDALNI